MALSLFLSLFSCTAKPPPAAPLTYKVHRGDLETFVSAPGRLAPARVVTVKSRAAGQILEIPVKEGDTVAAGKLLVRLDPEIEQVNLDKALADQRAAAAASRQAQVELEARQDDHRRSAELLASGFISQADHDARVRAEASAQAGLEIARSREQSVQHALTEARERLAYTEIRAPLAGVVLDLGVAVGQVVSSGATGFDAGTPLLTLADLSELLVIADVDETDAVKTAPGQEVRVEVDAYPGTIFPGAVKAVAPEAVRGGALTVVEVEIAIRDLKGATVRPGMSATVEIVTDRRENALLIPVEAALERDGPGVVVLKDGATAWRSVEFGPGDWEYVTVASGLTVGDLVVLPPGTVVSGGK